MEFANALDGVGIIIDIFAQVESEVGVVPVGVVSLVHLSLPALGTATRSVTLEAQSHIVDDSGFPFLDKRGCRHHILCGEGVDVIQCQ